MERESVFSTNIKSIGYEDNVLEIEFHSGGVYKYIGVTEEVYINFLNSNSKGQFFHYKIKDRYRDIKIR